LDLDISLKIIYEIIIFLRQRMKMSQSFRGCF